MEDDSRNSIVKSLKNEWSLFWDSLAGEEDGVENEDKNEDPFESGRLSVLSLDDVKKLTRELSQGRKTLNQRLENLNKEIELNSAKLESLRLVGSSDEDTLSKINELTDQGQKLAHDLAELDSRLRFAREEEDRIRRELTPA
ncbi:MAG: hypothetical protein KF789_05195 [Bdellovibrionaceae bacterium]|nr:hypothetical protein [Pseudobdellovibrionaceae bacterium]